MRYKVVLQRSEEGVAASVPGLPGCHSHWWTGFAEELPGCNVQERTLDEARASLKEAIQDVLQANRELARREAEGHEVLREAVAVPVE
jgi:predicted RNase H-like HicB family nuclease